MEIDFEYLTQVFFIVWFLTTIPIKLLIDEFRLIIYNDEIHKREKEIERDGHFFGKKYSKDIAKYEYMEGRYYSKFTSSLLKNLYPENRRYVKSRLALIRIIIINLTALVLGIVSLIISQYV